VYDAATLVVTKSRWAAASVATYGVDKARIRIIPFGVTMPPSSAALRPSPRPRLVFVGRSLARKGGHRLLRQYQEHFSAVADLDLVTMEEIAPRAGVRVINDIRPGDGRLTAILAEAAVFAFPSEMDLSPCAVLEAMAIGLPVVALRVGAISEIGRALRHGISSMPTTTVASSVRSKPSCAIRGELRRWGPRA
jgi:glycosyltransferase involved in cell wall biosynthesis